MQLHEKSPAQLGSLCCSLFLMSFDYVSTFDLHGWNIHLMKGIRMKDGLKESKFKELDCGMSYVCLSTCSKNLLY